MWGRSPHQLRPFQLSLSQTCFPRRYNRTRYSIAAPFGVSWQDPVGLRTSTFRLSLVRSCKIGTRSFVIWPPNHFHSIKAAQPSYYMHQRQQHSTGKTTKPLPAESTNGNPAMDITSNAHNHNHNHGHSHSILGHTHSHEDGHGHDAEQIIAALKGKGDRGSQITLVGLFSNVILTAAKGAAGWYLHSASLLADAGHSLSDLLGDFVTLFCWRLSRKPPSERYPYGFAKFETIGTTTISILLIGGALGIGFHSYHLLITTLSETAVALPSGPMREILQNITSSAPLPMLESDHIYSVDPNAAWFAATGVIVKEWLYRITKVVADEEKSPVLLANAIHHRSDAYSSLVAFFAIIGTWLFPLFPLDPIGGLVVSVVILVQGCSLLKGAWGDLTDAGVSPSTRQHITKILAPLVSTNVKSPKSSDAIPDLLSIDGVRARRAGSMIFVDVTVGVKSSVDVARTHTLEEKITNTLKAARKEITEVRVRFQPTDLQTPKKS